jgi:transcriptional regulator with XRE-family HTH domain
MAQKSDPSNDFLAAVGAKIRYYRQKAGFSLIQFGDDIGLDKGNLHKIESGKNITILTLLKIALLLKVDINKLISTNVKFSSKDGEKLVAKGQRSKPKAKKKSSRKK